MGERQEGIEQMLIQASNTKMPEINTIIKDMGNNTYIQFIDENLKNSITKTRGLKIKKPDARISEKVYQWTVLR